MKYLTIAKKCVRSLINLHRRHQGRAVPLKSFTFEITKQCNGRCIYCQIWRTPPLREMSLHDLQEGLTPSNLFTSVESIGITGGEPFLNHNIVEYVSYLTQLCPHAHIGFASNGILTDKILTRMREIREITPSPSIGISIDGFKTVDGFQRGDSEHWDHAWETVQLLQREQFQVAVGSVVTPYNIDEMVQFEQYCTAHSVPHSIMTVGESSHYYRNKGSVETLHLPRWRLHKFQQVCLNHPNIFRRYMAKYAEDPRQVMPCFSGFGSFFLTAVGDVYPCVQLTKCFGSLRDSCFGNLWGNGHAETARTHIRQQQCHCYTACEVSGWFRCNFIPVVWEKVMQRFEQLA